MDAAAVCDPFAVFVRHRVWRRGRTQRATSRCSRGAVARGCFGRAGCPLPVGRAGPTDSIGCGRSVPAAGRTPRRRRRALPLRRSCSQGSTCARARRAGSAARPCRLRARSRASPACRRTFAATVRLRRAFRRLRCEVQRALVREERRRVQDRQRHRRDGQRQRDAERDPGRAQHDVADRVLQRDGADARTRSGRRRRDSSPWRAARS